MTTVDLLLSDALRDRYVIERELGRGGMATVYLAQDCRHHRLVAIKVLHPELARAVGSERFLHEIEIIARLQHPHILPLHESGEGGGLLYFVMPYVAGESLRNRLARERQLPLDEALEIARQVASALAYAHSHGVVHRDIKPENILLTDDQAIVADFGLAWAVGQSGGERLTGTGLTLGTPAYMSPEQAAGERHLDGRSDIYSLACVVYEMLAGEPPFTGPTAQAVIARRFGGPPPRLHVIRDGVPEGVERAIDHALAKAPADRFSTALQFSAALSAPAGAFSQPPNLAPTARVVEGPSPALVPSPPDTAQPRSKHLGRVAALVVCVLGLAILGLRLTRPSPPAPSVSPKAIAVLPFLYRGSSEFSYLGEAMVELLSVKLEGSSGLRPVDARTLLTFASREGRIADPSHGAQVAQRFGSGLFVLGSITEAGGQLSVSATVYEVGGRPRNTFEALAGEEEEIFDLADRLARQILAEAQDEPLQFARVAGQTTTSLPALKVYLEGEREQRAGRPKTAKEAFQRAVELDTSFALAYYRLAGYFDDVPKAQEAVDRALRLSDRLGEHHRGLLLAMAAWLRGDHMAADQQCRLILAAHPDDAEAWKMLGELTLHKGHLLGRAWVDARAAYERVLALDPGSAWSLWWLAAIAAREGRRTDLDSLTDRFLQLKPHPDYAATARAQRAIALGDTAGEARFVAELRTRPDREAQASGGFVTWTTGNLSAGRRLWHLITEPSRSLGMRLLARVTLAKIELTNGRWRAAEAELKAAENMDAEAALEHRAYYALTRFLSVPDSELIVLRDSLQRWDPSEAAEEGDGLFRDHRGLHPYLRLYLLGLLSARLRDEPAARRYVAELERVDRSSPPGRFAADKAQIIRSELAWISGRRQEALTLLQGAQFWTNNSALEGTGDSPFTANFHERFARPELLYQLGREDEALPWYRSLAYDLLYTGPAELRQAQIYERKGDRRRAIEHYSRFIELWAESDGELQPMVRQAQQALVRLR